MIGLSTRASDICGYCKHRRDWHSVEHNESIQADLCRCMGADSQGRNRNWCDCSGFRKDEGA